MENILKLPTLKINGLNKNVLREMAFKKGSKIDNLLHQSGISFEQIDLRATIDQYNEDFNKSSKFRLLFLQNSFIIS